MLEALHRESFAYRDMKPGNFIVSAGIVYVVDFGLSARYQNSDKTKAPVMHHENRWWGRPLFLVQLDQHELQLQDDRDMLLEVYWQGLLAAIWATGKLMICAVPYRIVGQKGKHAYSTFTDCTNRPCSHDPRGLPAELIGETS